jgi:putative peptidoglycan lipid II flippase
VEGAKRFSEEVFGVLFSALLLITIAMELAMPLAGGLDYRSGLRAGDAEKFDAHGPAGSVMFPYLMCMSLTAMLSGMLNSLHHYLPPRSRRSSSMSC